MPEISWGKKKPITDYCHIFSQIVCPMDTELQNKIFFAKKLEMLSFRPELLRSQMEKRQAKDIRKFKKLCMNAEFMSSYYSCLANARTVGFIVRYLKSLDKHSDKADKLECHHLKNIGIHKAYYVFEKRLTHHKNENSWVLPYSKRKLSSLRAVMKEYGNQMHLCAAWVGITSKANIRNKEKLRIQLKAVEILSTDYLSFCQEFAPQQNPKEKLSRLISTPVVLCSNREYKNATKIAKAASKPYSKKF
ncbi:MAG: hypothetical protein MI749_05735 [Desulfovibrionales bacterium]|nr:hypothetical protein [Desulfovibrionales bacterium]